MLTNTAQTWSTIVVIIMSIHNNYVVDVKANAYRVSLKENDSTEMPKRMKNV